MNRTLEEMLRAFCGTPAMQDQWENFLPLTEFQYNNGVQSSTGYTPFYLNVGQHPHTPVSLTAGEESVAMQVPAAEVWLKAMEEALAAAQAAMERSQASAVQYYNRSRRPVEYKVGDFVYVAIQGLPKSRRGNKIGPRRRGPFKVVERIGRQAYRLDLPVTWNAHPVFHVSYLHPHRTDPQSWHEPPRLASVVEARWRGPQGERTLWFQVRHEDPAADEDIWMTQAELQTAAMHLWFDWNRDHNPDCVPVQILQERPHATERHTTEYQVLYNDGAKLWLEDEIVHYRAPTLMAEYIARVHVPDSSTTTLPDEAFDAQGYPIPSAAWPGATPIMRATVRRLCATQWVRHPAV
jgi:hypothetical protein